jgi:2-oxoisovalerate dehydrogenase E1 component
MPTIASAPITQQDIYDIIGEHISLDQFKQIVLADYRLAYESREASIWGRKEVISGKAKFGILGDGKELAQIALAKTFQNGDFRSGYYRDQTIMFAIGSLNLEQYFAQLYANPNPDEEPHSAGRQMNCHFATHSLDKNGNWNNLTAQKNTSSDISSTAAQMPRAIGLALASKQFRQTEALKNYPQFSNNGNEVTFCTIGDASTSEGPFWEAINAMNVLQIPLAVSVWDDGYGISVPRKLQTSKGSISTALSGFERNEDGEGMLIYTAKGWDYAELCRTYRKGIAQVRRHHIPALFHIQEVTQPQGHSTSGDHRRYKSTERLEWEKEYDCITRFKQWILDRDIATADELQTIEKEAKTTVRQAKQRAWESYNQPINEAADTLQQHLAQLVPSLDQQPSQSLIQAIWSDFANRQEKAISGQGAVLTMRDIAETARRVLFLSHAQPNNAIRQNLLQWTQNFQATKQDQYSSHLYSQSANATLKIPIVPAQYSDESPLLNGYEILNHCFDALFANNPLVCAFGEDVGNIGDVNQGMVGMQQKYGIDRVFDTGIRELTIMGQGIGMALRGLRPIAEIQYLDYLIYGLQILCDDAATLHYRTAGRQKAPIIVRTRGHRLEGIWHSGSPMGMMLHALRGMLLLVPRNMTQAAGFYNTLLQSDEPAIVIECLNGYRLKERLPDNIGEFTVPVGVPEIIRTGTDLSLITYGACCRIALEAAEWLAKVGIEIEIIDVQSLLPFDVHHYIVQSIRKTNRVLFLDEDVPGGATAYMMQQVMEQQNAYQYLDAAPATLSAQAHRPAYGSDGDYYSKPNAEDVFEKVYSIMHEFSPQKYPL